MIVTGLMTLLMSMLLPAVGSAGTSAPYPTVAAPVSHDRILIVAPHIDDEAIAAGGYAADAIARGADVYVVFLTAGDCNRFSARILHRTFEPTPSNYLAVGETRIAEAHAAMRLLGVPRGHYFVLGYPDRGLRTLLEHPDAEVRSLGTGAREVPYADAMSPGSPYTLESMMADLRSVVEIARPNVVIAPVAFDIHPDHSAAAELTDRVMNETGTVAKRLGYLVHDSRMPKALVPNSRRALLPPSRMKSLTWATYPLSAALLRKKSDLLALYRSQRPYTYILRSAFIRRNELFLVYPTVQTATLREPMIPIRAAVAR